MDSSYSIESRPRERRGSGGRGSGAVCRDWDPDERGSGQGQRADQSLPLCFYGGESDIYLVASPEQILDRQEFGDIKISCS